MAFEKVLTPEEILKNGGIDLSLLNIPSKEKTESKKEEIHLKSSPNLSLSIPTPTSIPNNLDFNSLSSKDLENLIYKAKEALLLKTYQSINIELLEAVDKILKTPKLGQEIVLIQAHSDGSTVKPVIHSLVLDLNLSSQKCAVFKELNTNVYVAFTSSNEVLQFLQDPETQIAKLMDAYLKEQENQQTNSVAESQTTFTTETEETNNNA